MRVHVPLDFWNGLKFERDGGRLPSFPTRITEPVQRDFRVRKLITRPAAPAAAAPAARPVKRPIRAKPEPVCRSYSALDENGDVIFVTVCE